MNDKMEMAASAREHIINQKKQLAQKSSQLSTVKSQPNLHQNINLNNQNRP